MTRTALLSVASLLIMTNAAAAPVIIDFTSDLWSGAEGKTEHELSYGSLGVKLSASGAMTFNADEANGTSVGGFAMTGDGIGILDDEISFRGGQSIDVLFSRDVQVLGYYFLDFYAGEGMLGLLGELASVTVGSDLHIDQAVGWTEPGLYEHNGLSVTTSKLSFSAGLPLGDSSQLFSTLGLSSNLVGGLDWNMFGQLDGEYGFSDYALAGVLIDDGSVSVPEPGSLGLLAFGLLGLGGLRRLRRS